MKDSNYKIKRDDVMVGRLVEVPFEERFLDTELIPLFTMYRNPPQEMIDDFKKALESRPWFIDYEKEVYHAKDIEKLLRFVLFVINEDKLFEDLLYDSPNYPVFNISSLEDCEKSLIVVDQPYKIGRALEYLGYGEELTYKDIVDIKDNLFQDWLLTHTELFGVYDTGPHGTGTECYDKYGVHHTFNDERGDGPIPLCYFAAWWSYACKRGIDHYIPKEDEKVRKLK